LNYHEYSLDFELARGKRVISFRGMKKEFGGFPTIAGILRSDKGSIGVVVLENVRKEVNELIKGTMGKDCNLQSSF